MAEIEVVRTDWHANKSDRYKALCDYVKHISTMSAGSILLVATLLDKVFHSPVAKGCITLAIISLGVSLILSSIAYLLVVLVVPKAQEVKAELEQNWMATCLMLTVATFVLGVGSVGAFFL